MALRTLALVALATAAIPVFAVSSATATTLELNGVTENKSVAFSASIAAGNSMVLARTDGTLTSTCASGTLAGSTSSPYSGTKVTGALSGLSWSSCSAGNPTVHQKGQLYIEHEAGTTNGQVFSENAEWTIPSSLGFTVNCKTGTGTALGTLTGVASGNATLHVNAILNCGFVLPSASWNGTYTVTTPGLGVSA